MNVVAVFTTQGQIMGEKVENLLGDGLTLKNPVLVINQGQSITFFPMLQFVDQKEATFSADKLLFSDEFTPTAPLQNEYNRMFGSGIQVVSTEQAAQATKGLQLVRT